MLTIHVNDLGIYSGHATKPYGSGTIFTRGEIWYVAYCVNGRQVQKSSRSRKIQHAKRLRDQILGRKGEMVNRHVERITCGELLDDFIERAESNSKPSSVKTGSWSLKRTSGRSSETSALDYAIIN